MCVFGELLLPEASCPVMHSIGRNLGMYVCFRLGLTSGGEASANLRAQFQVAKEQSDLIGSVFSKKKKAKEGKPGQRIQDSLESSAG